jgi:DNA mismatch repair protein MutL
VREAAAALWPRAGDGEAAGAEAPGFFGALRHIGQLARTFLLCETPAGDLVVIDQHAAHERIALQRLRDAWTRGETAGQPFLFPATLELAVADARVVVEHLAALGGLGFELEPFGGTTFALKAVPAALVGTEYRRVLGDLAARLAGRSFDEAADDLLATMACHASAKADQILGAEDARALLDALDGVDFQGSCPHGRPVVAELGLADLQKRAGRT